MLRPRPFQASSTADHVNMDETHTTLGKAGERYPNVDSIHSSPPNIYVFLLSKKCATSLATSTTRPSLASSLPGRLSLIHPGNFV
jgi:hypothetical protein